jgi:hypothetical protein
MRREVVFRYPNSRVLSRRLGQSARLARILGPENAERVEAFEADSASYFLDPGHAPCIGVVTDGELLCIAHSSRRTSEACELGINTATGARRRGFAAAATVVWTAAVKELGLVPIYSAFAWNTASLQLAASVGYTPRIDGAYGPIADSAE